MIVVYIFIVKNFIIDNVAYLSTVKNLELKNDKKAIEVFPKKYYNKYLVIFTKKHTVDILLHVNMIY
ncbi:hypothetical protein SAMN02910278_00204 [Peptostreptococcus sp. D1]|nr:hypothetical protein SAMN02910278_00204 [Peptostreptococcus sp. D1]